LSGREAPDECPTLFFFCEFRSARVARLRKDRLAMLTK
jgi:hypothetical protein